MPSRDFSRMLTLVHVSCMQEVVVMVALQIRDVPDDVRDALVAQAQTSASS